MKRKLSFIAIITLISFQIFAQPPAHTQDFRGMWVTKFKDSILGNTAKENELLSYASTNNFNYLICTNIFQILTEECGSFSIQMNQLRNFIDKAHTTYGIERISGNVGSDGTAAKIQEYNQCIDVAPSEKFDMITYECEFYNSSTNSSCDTFTSYFTQLNNIKNTCDATLSSDGTSDLVFEVYIGGEGSTGAVLTNSDSLQMQQIRNNCDHILLTYYRPTPSSSGGNFFNWTINRLKWLAQVGDDPTDIVLLLKSRNTDVNNMYNYLLTYPGTHLEALEDPYYSWIEGTGHNPSLTEGYIEQYTNGTYPWLTGIRVTGFTWFENAALLDIYNTFASTSEIEMQQNVKLFPNPSVSGESIIDSEERIDEIKLYNQLGMEVDFEFNHEINTIKLNNISTGVYFVKLKLENGITTSVKWIVQ